MHHVAYLVVFAFDPVDVDRFVSEEHEESVDASVEGELFPICVVLGFV